MFSRVFKSIGTSKSQIDIIGKSIPNGQIHLFGQINTKGNIDANGQIYPNGQIDPNGQINPNGQIDLGCQVLLTIRSECSNPFE